LRAAEGESSPRKRSKNGDLTEIFGKSSAAVWFLVDLSSKDLTSAVEAPEMMSHQKKQEFTE